MTLDRWLTIVGIVLSGLLSWIISRYYYKRSDKKPIPTFVLQSVKVLAAPELYTHGMVVGLGTHNVGRNGITEAVINFWNSGSLPIEQVLTPFTVSLPESMPILRSSVLKTNRTITGLRVSRPAEAPPNVVALEFTVLEPGDGATIQVIYDGSPKTTISFGGACLGAPSPTILPMDPVHFTPRYQRLRGGYKFLVPVLFSTGAISAVFAIGWVVRLIFGQHASALVGEIFAIACVGIVVASMIALVALGYRYLTAPYMPPDVRP